MLTEGTLNPKRGLNRRSMLRAAGVAMGLPLLDAMRFHPAEATAAEGKPGPGASGRRLVAISYNLGFHPPSFFPADTGKDYTPSEYLKLLEPLKQDFTVVSGTSHLDVRGGHETEGSFLTAAPYPRTPFKQSVSLDQVLASEMLGVTREPYLVLSTSPRGGGVMSPGLSYGRGGTPIPGIGSPAALFSQLFLDTGGAAAQKEKLARGQSVLDSVKAQADALRKSVGPGDRDKLAEYMDSVRDLEMKMAAAKAWASKPKPKTDAKAPVDATEPGKVIERMRLMYDMIHLALQADCTRVISLFVVDGGSASIGVEGVTTEHHDLTHHGKVEEKIVQLRKHELAEMAVVRDFLVKMKATRDGDGTLLDKTSVLLGCHMGEAARHNSQNLPILVAGGGFKHAGHLAFDKVNNRPLGNLFVSLLQRTGLDVDQFAGAKGTLTGLEWK